MTIINPLTKFEIAQVKAFLTDATCGENCWSAKEDICRCECGGKNHGINQRGENAVRSCKINGRRYELVAVGKHNDLYKQCREMIKQEDLASGKAWIDETTGDVMTRTNYYGDNRIVRYTVPFRKDSLGDYELRYASLPQCLKWKELAYFEVANIHDRYVSNAAILWKRSDINIRG